MKLLAACAVMLTAACTVSASQVTASSSTWTVSFRLTGGFAGVTRTLVVSSTGDLTADDSKRPGRVTAKATPEELAALNAFIAQQVPSRQAVSGSCADCFLYELDIDASGRRSNFRFDDATLMTSGIEPTVRTLVAMLNRVLAGR